MPAVRPKKSLYSTHVTNFTGYMEKVHRYFSTQSRGTVLDIPAGGGQLTDAMRALGFDVVPADANRERNEYTYVDMSEPLPFEDCQFDYCLSLEGIEHVLNPYRFVEELFRVTKPGGQVILSTPNINCLYSRLQFLFTGTFFQFNPTAIKAATEVVECERGHVSPLSLHTLRYYGEALGGRLVQIDGDKAKRLTLLPLYAAVVLSGLPWSLSLFAYRGDKRHGKRNRRMLRESYSLPVLFSRSLILIFQKPDDADAERESRIATGAAA